MTVLDNDRQIEADGYVTLDRSVIEQRQNRMQQRDASLFCESSNEKLISKVRLRDHASEKLLAMNEANIGKDR